MFFCFIASVEIYMNNYVLNILRILHTYSHTHASLHLCIETCRHIYTNTHTHIDTSTYTGKEILNVYIIEIEEIYQM